MPKLTCKSRHNLIGRLHAVINIAAFKNYIHKGVPQGNVLGFILYLCSCLPMDTDAAVCCEDDFNRCFDSFFTIVPFLMHNLLNLAVTINNCGY